MSLQPWAGAEQVFFQVTRPDTHELSLHWWEQLDDHEGTWSAWTSQQSMREGAWCLIYVTAPIKAFAWIARSLCDAQQPHGTGTAWSTFFELYPLGVPLGLADAQGVAGLGDWGALKSLQGTSKQIGDVEKWDALLARICETNPDVTAVLERWASTAPELPQEDLADFFWEGPTPDGGYPYGTERWGLQPALHDLLCAGGFGPMEDGRLPSMEARLDASSRADIVLEYDAEEINAPISGPDPLLVIETKLFASTTQGIEQLVRYRQWFEQELPDRDVRYVLAAQEISEAAVEAARAEDIAVWRIRFQDPELDLVTTGIDDDITLDDWWPATGGGADEQAANELVHRIRSAPRRGLQQASEELDDNEYRFVTIFHAAHSDNPGDVLAAGVTDDVSAAFAVLAVAALDWADYEAASVALSDESPATMRRARALLEPEVDLIGPGDQS